MPDRAKVTGISEPAAGCPLTLDPQMRFRLLDLLSIPGTEKSRAVQDIQYDIIEKVKLSEFEIETYTFTTVDGQTRIKSDLVKRMADRQITLEMAEQRLLEKLLSEWPSPPLNPGDVGWARKIENQFREWRITHK